MKDIQTRIEIKGDKKKYIIEVDGSVITRTSKRNYTHAVIGRNKPDGGYGYYGFCGRYDLAEKVYKEWSKIAYEIKIVELT